MSNNKAVIAYKAFFKGLTNNMDGIQYEVGKTYITKDKIQYQKGGFHMCEQFEDCFKYLYATEAELDLTLVKGFGDYYEIRIRH